MKYAYTAEVWSFRQNVNSNPMAHWVLYANGNGTAESRIVGYSAKREETGYGEYCDAPLTFLRKMFPGQNFEAVQLEGSRAEDRILFGIRFASA